jgi:hypothetical protein
MSCLQQNHRDICEIIHYLPSYRKMIYSDLYDLNKKRPCKPYICAFDSTSNDPKSCIHAFPIYTLINSIPQTLQIPPSLLTSPTPPNHLPDRPLLNLPRILIPLLHRLLNPYLNIPLLHPVPLQIPRHIQFLQQ